MRILTHAFEDQQILNLQVSIFISEIPLQRVLILIFADGHVIVCLPVNDKVTRDIEFPSDIPCSDFRDRVMAAMNLNPATALLGWKTSDEPKHAATHELTTDSDIDNTYIQGHPQYPEQPTQEEGNYSGDNPLGRSV
jgi:hypothetical protein